MYCIMNATIHDGFEHVFKGDILIDGNKIIEVKDHIAFDGECYDATGQHVFPGFIDPMSNWGILGPGREIRGNAEDNDEHTNVITPEMDVLYAFNGRGVTRQQLGAFGITSVGVAPSSTNLFGGKMAVFDVDGINPFKMCIKEQVGLKACVERSVCDYYGAKNMIPSTHMGIFSLFQEHLKSASEYDPTKDDRDPKKAAIKDVLDKKMPLFVCAKTPMEVHGVLHVLKDYDIDLVLCSGYGLKDSEEELLKRNVSVIVNNNDIAFDPYTEELDRPFLYELYKKGICVALASNCSGTMASREDVLWNAISMYKVCHDEEAVIKMMTSNTASILGIDHITGSIETGKRADLVIYSDHPIKTYQAVLQQTIANGKIIYRKGDEMKCFI